MTTPDRVAQISPPTMSGIPVPQLILQVLWLSFEPKSVAGIKAEQRAQQETVGIPVPDLKAIGKALAKKLLPEFAPLLLQYERWAADPELRAQDRRSVESAVRALQGVQGEHRTR